MKIYIAGPMTGYPEHNFPAFHKAASWLRDKGHTVVSPAELDQNTGKGAFDPKRWAEFMATDIKLLVDCEAVVLLYGWHGSKGAQLERLIAMQLGMTVFYGAVEVPIIPDIRSTPEEQGLTPGGEQPANVRSQPLADYLGIPNDCQCSNCRYVRRVAP